MEARRTPRSAARLSAVYFAPRWPRCSLFPRFLHCCMEKAGIREARKRRFLMPETKHESKAAGRLALLLGLVVVVAFGLFIYSGIHGRLEAATTLQHQTELAAIEDVIVVDPKAAAPIDEVVLPGATQPYLNSPIYARTKRDLIKW